MPSTGIPKKRRDHAKVVASNSCPSHARDTLSDAGKKGQGATATSGAPLPLVVPAFANAAEAQTGPPLPFLMPRPRNEPPVNPHHPASGGGGAAALSSNANVANVALQAPPPLAGGGHVAASPPLSAPASAVASESGGENAHSSDLCIQSADSEELNYKHWNPVEDRKLLLYGTCR